MRASSHRKYAMNCENSAPAEVSVNEAGGGAPFPARQLRLRATSERYLYYSK